MSYQANYQEILDNYKELKENLALKKEAIVKRNLEDLSKLDENCTVICEKIAKIDMPESLKTLTDNEKQELKTLGDEIKILEENNEILINHSLGVINNILSGILNITQADKCSYNSKGKTLGDSESLNISSITEEA